ncbi:MAG: malto-oligosyltrehalose trehalohydrolase [Ramlibacter sp.]|nr:malto-oligosyltrehalose trehalohydrolase [Ramlibacter sp.]
MPFGASLRDGGGVDFRLWAPAAASCELALYLGAAPEPLLLPAEADTAGWWECFADVAMAGSRYQWRIDGQPLVPDPASRQNPDGVHQPSSVVDPAQFEWDGGWLGRPWSEVVLYELHVGAFTREGTFAAAAGRLEQLAALGITAIELMPVAAFGGRFGWGYDGVLPFAPHPAYGTPDELKHLVQQAHRLNMMVFLDVVYNHFGPDGNYLGRYAPDFFSKTHQSPWGAAINFDGPGSRTVRDFFIHNALYWIEEYRIDGLRLDAVHAITDSSEPDVVEELSHAVREMAGSRHVHLVTENENNVHRRLAGEPQPGRYDGQWNDDFHHALYVSLTGDSSGYYHDYGAQPVDLLARSLTNGMLFESSHRQPGGAREACIPAPPQPLSAMVNCAHNHDQTGNRAFGERLTQLVPPAAAELATLLALLTPATPLLFMGEEFGATEPFLYFADWEGELREAVREGRKREFGHVVRQADGTERPLPDPCDARTFAASHPDQAGCETGRGRYWLQRVRDALAVRRQAIVPRQGLLATGDHRSERIGPGGIRVRWHYRDRAVLALDLNISPEPLDAGSGALAVPAAAEVLFEQNRPDRDPVSRHWPAWSALWFIGGHTAPCATPSA